MINVSPFRLNTALTGDEETVALLDLALRYKKPLNPNTIVLVPR